MHTQFLDSADGIKAVDAAFTYQHRAWRNPRRKLLCRRKTHFEGIEIAVIDTDYSSASSNCGLELAFRMDFDERIERQGSRMFAQITYQGRVQHCRNQQHGVSPVAFGFDDLIGIENKVFAQ